MQGGEGSGCRKRLRSSLLKADSVWGMMRMWLVRTSMADCSKFPRSNEGGFQTAKTTAQIS